MPALPTILAVVLSLLAVSVCRADDRSTCLAGHSNAETIAACARIIEGKQRPRGTVDLAVIYNQRGLAHERAGAHDLAVADLNEAIRLDPNSAVSFNNRSWTYGNIGEYELAIADASEAIRLNRSYVIAYVNRGTSYEKKGDLEHAIGDYSEAIKLNPKFAAAYNNRGVCYDKTGQYDRAILDFNEAVRLNPREAATYFNRAVTYEKKEDFNKALANYQAAAGLSRNDPAIAAAVAQIERKLREKSESDLAAVIPPPPPPAPKKPVPAPPVDLGRRVALVIGNSAYKSVAQLANPTRDAKALASLFRSSGFTVVEERQNLDLGSLRRALREFSEAARDADIAVVYFAGHGMEVSGTNYLIPVDARLERDTDIEDESISLDRVLQLLEPVKRLRLVILDACRDNGFIPRMKRMSASRSIGRGLAVIEPAVSDTLVAFAAKAGSTAADGQGANSPYAVALLKHLATPGLDLRLALGRVRDDVLADTGRRQEPFVYGSLGGAEISLVPPAPQK